MTDKEAAEILSAYSDFLQSRGPYRFDPRSRNVPPDFRDVYPMQALYKALDYAVDRMNADGSCQTITKDRRK